MKLVVILSLLTALALSADSQVQIHVAIGSVPGQITFTWSTRSATPTTYVKLTNSSTWDYYSGTTRDFKDGSNIWVIHAVTAQLVPGGRYQYQVGCQVTGFSSSYSLIVPVDKQPGTYLLLGDLATDADGKDTWNDIQSMAKDWLIQTIVHAGDIAYDLSSSSSTVGDDYMATIQPIAHYLPYMVAAGNHETTDGYYNYLQRFDMPNTKFYYTFTVGLVRILAIHTEAFLTETDMLPDMLTYIKQVLNRSDQDKQDYPWLIVYGHRPMYCSSKAKADACGPEADTIKGYLEYFFKQYDVDIYVNGHVHNYQRTAPVYQGQITSQYDEYSSTYINPQSTIYVTTGGAGSDGSNSKVDLTNAPNWLIAADTDFTFSVLTVYNSTTLLWQQLKTKNNAISDAFWLIKK